MNENQIFIVKNFDNKYVYTSKGWNDFIGVKSKGQNDGWLIKNFMHLSPCHSRDIEETFLSQDEKANRGEVLVILDIYFYRKKFTIFLTKKIPYIEGGKIRGCVGIANTIDNPSFRYISYLLDVPGICTVATSKQNLEKHIRSNISNYHLSYQEIESIKYLIKGFKVVEIAKKLNLSDRTVEEHLRIGRMKLRCSNRMELTEKAINLGLELLSPIIPTDRAI